MVAHASCLHSMIMRRLGRLEEAADAARLALDFKLATSPPLAVAWAAGSLGVDALTRLGRLDEADAMACVAAGREPQEGWIHTLTFRQARGRAAGRAGTARTRPWLTCSRAGRGLAGPGRQRTRPSHRGAPPRSPRTAPSASMTRPPRWPRSSSRWREQGSACLLTLSASRWRVHGGPDSRAIGVSRSQPGPRTSWPLALAGHGASLRRSGRRTQAREPLLRALDLAERTGAAGLAAEVRRELRATGARPRRTALTGPDALTAGERRVADLAADGARNRQIAEHLFVTQATVETHLRHAFRKLNITSRAELPATLNG